MLELTSNRKLKSFNETFDQMDGQRHWFMGVSHGNTKKQGLDFAWAGRASPSTRAPSSGLSRLQSPVVCRKGAISGHWSLHRGTGLSEDLRRFPVCSGVRKSACCHSRRLAAVMTYLAGLCFCTIISVKCGSTHPDCLRACGLI